MIALSLISPASSLYLEGDRKHSVAILNRIRTVRYTSSVGTSLT